jgi:hypothetical protein
MAETIFPSTRAANSPAPPNKPFDVITRRTILKFRQAQGWRQRLLTQSRTLFFVPLKQTPLERQRVQRTLEQFVYESLEN